MADSAVANDTFVVHHDTAPSSAGRHWSDLVGFAVFFTITVRIVILAPSLSIGLIPVMGYELGTAFGFLIRGRPIATARGLGPRLAAYGGTFAFQIFLWIATTWAPAWLTPIASTFPVAAPWVHLTSNILLLLGALLSAWGLWDLRHSLSLEPAARVLVTRGAYRISRHPLYLAYLLSYGGLTIEHPTAPMMLALAIWLMFTVFRIRYEEQVLTAAYPGYAIYRERVGLLGPRVFAHRMRSADT